MNYDLVYENFLGLPLSVTPKGHEGDIEFISRNVAFYGPSSPEFTSELMLSGKPGISDAVPKHWMRNQKDSGYNIMTYAIVAGNKEAIWWLINHQWDVNLPDERGWTPLIWACILGRHEIARILVSSGASTHRQTMSGKSTQLMVYKNQSFTSFSDILETDISKRRSRLVYNPKTFSPSKRTSLEFVENDNDKFAFDFARIKPSELIVFDLIDLPKILTITRIHAGKPDPMVPLQGNILFLCARYARTMQSIEFSRVFFNIAFDFLSAALPDAPNFTRSLHTFSILSYTTSNLLQLLYFLRKDEVLGPLTGKEQESCIKLFTRFHHTMCGAMINERLKALIYPYLVKEESTDKGKTPEAFCDCLLEHLCILYENGYSEEHFCLVLERTCYELDTQMAKALVMNKTSRAAGVHLLGSIAALQDWFKNTIAFRAEFPKTTQLCKLLQVVSILRGVDELRQWSAGVKPKVVAVLLDNYHLERGENKLHLDLVNYAKRVKHQLRKEKKNGNGQTHKVLKNDAYHNNSGKVTEPMTPGISSKLSTPMAMSPASPTSPTNQGSSPRTAVIPIDHLLAQVVVKVPYVPKDIIPLLYTA